ncbi:hypothetical protein CEY16_01365 [Halalkalibacillus sediminis]|uniref:PepSY domain-containing protein n=1 Tax=Halalkalibacillus sediminis TaxID=2018042 RepID=A0A2I0QVU3_9BACI|nr:PepSY domain-containing protein [Halalkalibacillus sediminis]PKR78434.1 hypothetical protein CEY16_01365 [Halalkalibacillus sediminis]
MNKERIIWMVGGSILTIVLFLIGQQFVFGSSSADEISSDEASEIVKDRYGGSVTSIDNSRGNYVITLEHTNGIYSIQVDQSSGRVSDVEQLEEFQKESDNEVSDSSEEPSQENQDNKNPEESDDSVTDKNNDSETDQNDDPPSEEKEEDMESNEEEEIEEEKIVEVLPIEEAEQIALNNVSGEISHSEFIESEKPFYEIIIENDKQTSTFQIDALEGEIISRVDEEKNQKPTVITEEEAIEIALNEISGEVEDIELKEVDGNLFYELELEVEFEDDDDENYVIQINAINGKIQSVIQSD